MERGGKRISKKKKMGQTDSGICYTKFRQTFDMVWGSECQVANLLFSFGFGGIAFISSVLFVWHLTFNYLSVNKF